MFSGRLCSSLRSCVASLDAIDVRAALQPRPQQHSLSTSGSMPFAHLLAFPTARCASARVRSRERKPEMQRERERSPQRNRETDRQTGGQRLSSLPRDIKKKNITHAHAHAHAYVILTLTSTMMTRGCNAARLPRPPHARRRSPSPLRSARPLAPPLPFAVCTGPLCKKHPGIKLILKFLYQVNTRAFLFAFPERKVEASRNSKKKMDSEEPGRVRSAATRPWKGKE